jgi:beta-mannosidase
MAIETQAISHWRLKDFDIGGGEAAAAFDAALESSDWIDIPAPGDVYLALHAAGRLPDPLGDRAEEACAWVIDREWWQRADFEAPALAAGQRLRLTFKGLDTFATVWLNGEVVGRSDNMFRSLVIDITAQVNPGLNRLAVRFIPPSTVTLDEEVPVWPMGGETVQKSKRNLIRKAQFGWGWDWGPTLPTVGVWKPVTLSVEQAAALSAVKFTTLELTPNRERARVSVQVTAEAFAAEAPLAAEVVLTAPGGAVADQATVFRICGGRRNWGPRPSMGWRSP